MSIFSILRGALEIKTTVPLSIVYLSWSVCLTHKCQYMPEIFRHKVLGPLRMAILPQHTCMVRILEKIARNHVLTLWRVYGNEPNVVTLRFGSHGGGVHNSTIQDVYVVE